LGDQFKQDWEMLQGGRLDPNVFDARWGEFVIALNPEAQARIDDMFMRQRERETISVYDTYANRVNEDLQN
jgi:hypothetical protein